MAKKSSLHKTVETHKHNEAKRRNIPTTEFQSVLHKEQESPRTAKYPRNTGFYQRDQSQSNRMIFGDSLQVMASLARRKSCTEKCSAFISAENSY